MSFLLTAPNNPRGQKGRLLVWSTLGGWNRRYLCLIVFDLWLKLHVACIIDQPNRGGNCRFDRPTLDCKGPLIRSIRINSHMQDMTHLQIYRYLSTNFDAKEISTFNLYLLILASEFEILGLNIKVGHSVTFMVTYLLFCSLPSLHL